MKMSLEARHQACIHLLSRERLPARLCLLILPLAFSLRAGGAAAGGSPERLGRGAAAPRAADGSVLVSWRLLATDPTGISFHVYRSVGSGPPVRLTAAPLRGATGWRDRAAPTGAAYRVRAVRDGREGEEPGGAAAAWSGPYHAIPLRTPPGYAPNDASAGDLDGDGEYDLVLHQAGRGRDNSQAGQTDPPILQAYRLDGRMLWQVNLGRNVREGAHYNPFMVFDLDGDGRAEVACRASDGATDGCGRVLGDATADHRDGRGYVLRGPEFLVILDGRTGGALAVTNFIPARGRVEDWGDGHGNRVDRFLACVACLDGKRPSLVMTRGYYAKTMLAAWDWRDGKLSLRWVFDSHDGTPGNRAYAGQGNHNLFVADVDGDGRDEIAYGSMVVDDGGRGLYSTGLGHGDAMHLSDLDPAHPGLEVFGIHEAARHPHGIDFRDARTGRILWSRRSSDVVRGMAADIDPRHPGAECWAFGEGLRTLFSSRGEAIGAMPRTCNMAAWWDGDLLRELLSGTTISKWDYERGREVPMVSARSHGCVSVNGSKANPSLVADLLGDWREEVVWPSRDGRELRIFATTIPTAHRLTTLMHDPVYRLGVAWQNVGYNQPPHPGFFLGDGMRSSPGAEPAVESP